MVAYHHHHHQDVPAARPTFEEILNRLVNIKKDLYSPEVRNHHDDRSEESKSVTTNTVAAGDVDHQHGATDFTSRSHGDLRREEMTRSADTVLRRGGSKSVGKF